jgi:type II secretion system protein N
MQWATRVIAILASAGCGSSAATVPAPPFAAAPAASPPATDQLAITTAFEAGVEHVRVTGSGVELETLPVADWIGLPMSGRASIAVDVRVPVAHGRRDWSKAAGDVRLDCTSCRLGDDRAKLRLAVPKRAAVLAGNGIEFGHVALDSVSIALRVGDGHATITRWQIGSLDLAFEMSLDIALAAAFDDSTVTGCLQFMPTEALRLREPSTFAAIMVTGAEMAPKGKFEIRLAGTFGDVRRLAQTCDGSEPLRPLDAPEGPQHPTLIPAPPPAADADPIKRLDDTHFEVDVALIAQVMANPMELAKTARVVPAGKGGFKLYAIRPSSVLAKLGLENGDALHAVAGIAIDSADAALQAYTAVGALQPGQSFDVALTRRGKPLAITYRVR